MRGISGGISMYLKKAKYLPSIVYGVRWGVPPATSSPSKAVQERFKQSCSQPSRCLTCTPDLPANRDPQLDDPHLTVPASEAGPEDRARFPVQTGHVCTQRDKIIFGNRLVSVSHAVKNMGRSEGVGEQSVSGLRSGQQRRGSAGA
jgi:hypothetical protein